MRSAFARYLSPQLVEVLAQHPDRLQLGGEEREMTFLFTDLEGFTAFTGGRRTRAARLNPEPVPRRRLRHRDGSWRDHRQDRRRCRARDVQCAARPARSCRPRGALRAGDRLLRRNLRGRRRADRRGRPGVRDDSDRKSTRAAPSWAISAATAASTTRPMATPSTRRPGSKPRTSGSARASAYRARPSTPISDMDIFGFRPIGALELKGKAKAVEVFSPSRADAPEASWADRYGDAFARLSRGQEDGADAIRALLRLYPDDALLQFHAARIARGQRGTSVALQAA